MQSPFANAIAAVLSNLGAILIVVALVVAAARVARERARRVPVNGADVYWQELLFYAVGVSFIYVGLIHAFFQELASKDIGWAPSPFEYELGFAEVGLGIVALLSRWRGFDMRLAVTIVFAVFSFAAAAQHIYYIVCCGNMHPGNAGIVLWVDDIALPLVLVFLAWRASRG
jgi:hypothetical protein